MTENEQELTIDDHLIALSEGFEASTFYMNIDSNITNLLREAVFSTEDAYEMRKYLIVLGELYDPYIRRMHANGSHNVSKALERTTI